MTTVCEKYFIPSEVTTPMCFAIPDYNIIYNILPDFEIFLIKDSLLHICPVQRLVALNSCRSNGGALPHIKRPELEHGSVRRSGHLAAEGIKLLDKLPFPDTADRGVAWHLADKVDIAGDKKRP